MKEKVIETAGKTWKTLGERGESTVSDLSKILKEREDIVNQAIGWLAREDKISFATKKNSTVISLASAELEAFKRVYQGAAPAKSSNRQTKS